ncbi:DUF7537 family lipoprotein [Haloplanus sp.]|uniref:DUF7537 family lipoprotein n=1 Tax=Haloplanus sp. TaxID=1961696 RepID=UPI00261E9C09|nr:hypothetical protein [Haloplanus sp.]
MSRHRAAVTAVTLVVVLAGCGGLIPGGDDTSTPTVTSTSTSTPTDTPRSTDRLADGAVSPVGWSENGVTNTTTAFRGHYSAVLSGPSTTVTYRSGVRSAEADRATNTSLEMRLDTGEKRLHASINGSSERREAYFSDGTFSQWSVREETVVNRTNTSFVPVTQSIDNGVLKSQLLLYELELTDIVTRDGTTAFVYDVVGVYDNAVSGTYGSATSGTGRVVVSERGRIIEIDTTVTYTGGEVTYHYEQTRLGATEVESPDWRRDA